MSPTNREFVELLKVVARQRDYRPTPPASRAEVEALHARAIDKLAAVLPDPYVEFLSLMDGFYKSGMQLYASHQRPLVRANGTEHPTVRIDDVIEMTLELRQDPLYPSEHLVFLARDSRDRGWDTVRNVWFGRYVDGGAERIYRSFLEMIADGLWAEGVDVRHLMPRDFQFSSLEAQGKKVSGTRD